MGCAVFASPNLTPNLIWHLQLFMFELTAYKFGESVRSLCSTLKVGTSPYPMKWANLILHRSTRLYFQLFNVMPARPATDFNAGHATWE